MALLLFLGSSRLIVQHAPVGLWGGAFSRWATPVTMGLASGLLIGAALGLLFKQRARVVAIGAGVLQVMLVMSSGFYLETFILSFAIGIGLFLGALVVSRPKHV
ncbi:MAG TPA: hypothetical protein VFR91_09135 [Dyella sp.]|nr:hypothetical protein [Dyella sp.]